jgi:hypothetical protein
LRRAVVITAAVCWAALLVLGMAAHRPLSPVPFFPQGIDQFKWGVFAAVWCRHLLSLAVVAGWLVALAAWGRPAAGLLRLDGRPLGGQAGMGLGFGLLGLAVLGLGLAGLLHAIPLALGLAAPFALVSWRRVLPRATLGQHGLLRGPRALPRATLGQLCWPRWPRFSLGEDWPFKLAIASAVLLALPAMLSPEGSWDAVVYHLRIPSFALIEHKWFLAADSPFASYPPLMELHYLLALGLTSIDDVPKLMHAACWLMTARVLFIALRAAPPSAAGEAGGALVHPAPVASMACSAGPAGHAPARPAPGLALPIPAAGAKVAVDFGDRQTSFAARGSVLLWLLSPLGMHLAGMAYIDHATAWLATLAVVFSLGPGTGGALCAGVFAGFAFLTKYTGGFAFLGVSACLLFYRRRPRACLLAACGAAAVSVPWLARNWLCLGNPVHPFLYRALGGISTATTDYWLDPVNSDLGLLAVLARPWTASVADDGGVGAVLSPLWLAVLPAAGFGMLGRSWPFFAAAGIAWWVMPLDCRFLFPFVPAALIAAAPAWRDRAFVKVALCATAVMLPFCLREAAFASFRQFDPLPPALGLRTREVHLRNGLSPQPEYWDASQAINKETPARSRVLILASIKSYYIDRRCSTDHQHINPVPVLRYLRLAGAVDRLAIRLKQEGYTHFLCLHRASIVAARSSRAAMTDREAELYVEWLRTRTSFAFRRGEALVYHVRRGGAPRKLGRVPLLEEEAMTEVTERRPGNACRQLYRYAPGSSSGETARGVVILLDPANPPSAARAALEAAVASFEASAIAWRALGFVMERQGDLPRALACYRRAVEINPSDPECRDSLRYLTGRLSSAVRR